MNDLVRAFEKENFFPSEIIPDGKIHRFKKHPTDREKSSWYVAYLNNSPRGGEPFYVATWGDWHEPDDVYKFCSLTTQSSSDKKLIEELIRKAERKRVQEQDRVYEETSKKVTEAWQTLADSGSTPYLEKKGLSELFGARISGEILCVPVMDASGKMWGVQKIEPSGRKMFASGTKKKGNFYVLRAEHEIKDLVYVCEGFATAASIHLATGENVVCAFDAGNLEPVCESLRQAYRDVSIILCGDDDRFTTRADGSLWNPGREKAENAAKRYLGRAIFPKFESTESRGTDFNDLHVAEGLNRVREQIAQVKAQKYYIVALGHRNLTYFYTSNYNRQILALNSHSSENLLSLQPLEYWEQLYMGKTGVDWQKAASDLKKLCHSKGIFNAGRVRGLGVWLDDSRIVVHLGNRLWCQNREIGLHDLDSEHIYSLEESQKSLEGMPLESCALLTTTIKNIAWAREQDSIFFSGWLVAAMLSGTIHWRPHMWLTGGTGAGKSTIYEIINKVMRGYVVTLGGGTTEAGMRRAVRGSALPIIFDEFELNDEATMNENQKVLAFMRQASSDSMAQIVKAEMGSNGTVTYQPRFCAFVTGIRPSFNNEADRNRFTVIQLDKRKQNVDQYSIVNSGLKQIDEEYCTGLFLRCLSLIDVFQENLEICKQILAERHYARFAQQFAPILAGYLILGSNEVASHEKVRLLVDALKLENEISEIREQNDEEEAVTHLLQTKLRTSSYGDRSVKELVNMCANPGINDDVNWAIATLMRYGLKWNTGESRLFVANKNPELSKIFEKTRFSVNWKYSLSRIDGAITDKTANIFGQTVRGTLVPINFVL